MQEEAGRPSAEAAEPHQGQQAQVLLKCPCPLSAGSGGGRRPRLGAGQAGPAGRAPAPQGTAGVGPQRPSWGPAPGLCGLGDHCSSSSLSGVPAPASSLATSFHRMRHHRWQQGTQLGGPSCPLPPRSQGVHSSSSTLPLTISRMSFYTQSVFTPFSHLPRAGHTGG